jgi:hypothetical protein
LLLRPNEHVKTNEHAKTFTGAARTTSKFST